MIVVSFYQYFVCINSIYAYNKLKVTNTFPICLDIIVSFTILTYSVNEDDGPAQPVLVLSNPSATDITVYLYSTDQSATGEYCSAVCIYIRSCLFSW